MELQGRLLPPAVSTQLARRLGTGYHELYK